MRWRNSTGLGSWSLCRVTAGEPQNIYYQALSPKQCIDKHIQRILFPILLNTLTSHWLNVLVDTRMSNGRYVEKEA